MTPTMPTLDPFGRSLDVGLAAGAALVQGPAALVARGLGARLEVVRTERIGRQGRTFTELSWRVTGSRGTGLARIFALDRLPTLWNVLRGEMGLVGPRALAPSEADELATDAASTQALERRHAVRPGLISLHWIRRRGQVAYASELADDLEYVSAPTLRRRLGILVRAALVRTQGGGAGQAPPPFLRILGVRVHNLTMAATVERITGWLAGGTPRRVAFVNTDCLNRCRGDFEYRGTLNLAHLTLADGSGVRLAGQILRQPIRENVNGTDLFPQLCAALEGTGHGVFLLGGRPGVAEGVAEWIRRHHPGVRVAGTRDGFFEAGEETAVVEEIRASGAALLLVALGAPRQDLWIRDHLADTGARVGIGVGGLFDFYSGRIPRAPMWMRELGMEWIYRFWQEPGRMWRRYWVGNFVFLARVAIETVARQDGVLMPGSRNQEVGS